MTIASRLLRVCHVMSADLWAGAEVQVATLASYLVEQPDVQLSAVLFNDGWLAGELRRLGVDFEVVDERTHNAAAIVRFITEFLSARRVDIVHTHRYKDNILGTVAAKLARVPCVVRTVHGLPEPIRGLRRFYANACEALDRIVLSLNADRIVAVSRTTARSLEHRGYKPSALTHIHNGIDLRAVQAARPVAEVRAAFGIAADAFLVGTAGRFAPVKGHEHLLRAAALIRERLPRARFMLVGSGPLEPELRTLAANLRVADACLFVDPSVDGHATVYDLVRAMDAFVLPSLSEGIPMALLEAMALGRPVVATGVGGVPEIVASGSNGVLVPPANAEALAAACLKVQSNGVWSASLGTSAERTVRERFTRERNGESIMTLYRDVASDSERNSPRTLTATALFVAPLRAVLSYGRRVVLVRRELRRAGRIRRNPAALVSRLQAAHRVLVLCQGNIIRSAYAANLLERELGAGAQIEVRSAGLGAIAGRPAHPLAIATAAPRVDLARHAATPVRADLVAWADVIFVMEALQLIALRRRFPEARTKTFLLSTVATNCPLEIRDPFDAGADVFRTCFNHIDRAAAAIVGVFTGTVHEAIPQTSSRQPDLRLALR